MNETMMIFVEHVVKEMLTRVGLTSKEAKEILASGFLTQKEWYTSYSWTLAEQESFEKWFVDYIYQNKEARTALCAHPRRSKTYLRKVAKEWTFQFGWSLQKEL